MNMNEAYLIGIDFAEDEDTLIVARLVAGRIEVINTFHGEKALALHKELTEAATEVE